MSFAVNKILDLSAAFGLYDWWARRNLGQVHDRLTELADLRGRAEILDVGCGTGMLSSRLAETAGGLVVRGVDISSRMIQAARKRARTRHLRAEYQVGTAAKLPYPNEQFDLVLSCLLFHLLERPEQERALQEILRVLKPGSRYVCAEFDRYPVRFLRRKLSEYPRNLVGTTGFRIQAQFAGPFLTRYRPVVYRVLMKPE